MAFLLIPLLVVLSAFQTEAYQRNRHPQNSWVYFGRGLNQREIIDLARLKELETTTTTTQKALETTLESLVTTNDPTTTKLIPTTDDPVPTKDIPNVRNLPEVVVAETTVEPLVEKTSTNRPGGSTSEASTSEAPLRAKIVVIPKEVASTTDASEELTSHPTTPTVAPEPTSTTKEAKSKEISASSEEITAPSLRTMLRRIFNGSTLLRRKA